MKECVSHHFACDCREAGFSELKRERDDYREALKKIAFDNSPPWDNTDFKKIAREALLTNEVEI